MDLRYQRSALAWCWAAYVRWLERQPILAKAVTNGVLSGAEEASTQAITGKGDRERVLKMTLFGLLVKGPLGHYLYEVVGKLFPSSSLAHSIGQLLAVNFFVAPVQTAVYYVGMGAIDGQDLEGIVRYVRANFWGTMLITWKLFPAIQVGTLKLLPQALWLPWFNLLGFVFGVYCNYAAQARAKPERAHAQ